MLQHAELGQRFAAGDAPARGIIANISQPAMAARCEARQALKGTGKLLIRRIFSHSGVRSVTGE
ncbi:hypothetical protein J4734_11980 [Klebsiella pneumoniae]|uniref:Uncharacterized protein n=1 Tax=Klebsiella pneumoniae TaxID=573 RepID=A0A939NTC3_KLEPN|nr:hypothetical protein [Klebsiella pneumoniae]